MLRRILLIALISMNPVSLADTKLVPKPGSTKSGGAGGGITWSTPANASIVPDADGTYTVGSATEAFDIGYFYYLQNGTNQLGLDGSVTIDSADGLVVNDLGATTGVLLSTNVFVGIQNPAATASTALRFYDNDNSNYVSLKSSGTVSSNISWTLPAADGTSGQVLSTNGSGVLSWATAGGGADPSLLGNGTAGAPSYSFTADPDTGVYRSAANRLGFSSGGAQIAYVDSGSGLMPGADNSYEFGSTSAAWFTISGKFINAIDVVLNQSTMNFDGTGTTMITSGASVQGRINADYVVTGNKNVGLQTGANNTADAVATGSWYFETGNKNAGSGNSGGFFFQSGSSSGGSRGDMTWNIDVWSIPKTVTTGGTTGAQTIDKISGTVNFAAAATSLVVTNSTVSTSSLVHAVARTNDTTCSVKSVVPAAGSFEIFMTAACTAETSVGFLVTN